MTGYGGGFYPGHVVQANENGTFVVHFGDGTGDIDKKMKPKNMRHDLSRGADGFT